MAGYNQRRRLCFGRKVTSSIVALILATNANALLASDLNDASAGTSPNAGSPEDSTVEEILVTARKRSENLQETPVAITAFTGKAIVDAFATDFRDFNGQSPNVLIEENEGFGSATAFTIRGLGTSDVESAYEPAVGVVVDGIFFARATGGLVDLFDVEQIEVLRGPQGILFGKNTTGGSINMVSKKPNGEFRGEGEIKLGNYKRIEVRAAVETPITDTLALRVSGFSVHADGYVKDLNTGKDRGGEDVSGLRGVLVFKPNNNIDSTFIAEYTRDRSGGFGPQRVDSFGNPGPVSFLPSGKVDLDGRPRAGRYSAPDKIFVDAYFLANTTNIDLGNHVLTSVTGWRRFNESINLDLDATDDAPGFGTINVDLTRDQPYTQFSQELRIASNDRASRLSYVLGLYYFRSRYQLEQTVFFGTPLPLPSSGDQTVNSYAVFGQANYEIASGLRLTLGGRYTTERKRFASDTLDVGLFGCFDPAFAAANPICAGGANNPFTNTAVDFRDKLKSSNFSPKVGLDYKFSDDVFAYASWTRGFKSGGYNGRATDSTPKADGGNLVGPYKDETVDSFELGVKTDLLDRRLRANVALFWNEFKDAQLEVLTQTNGPALGTSIENAGKLRTRGIEAEITAVPVDRLTLNASIGYLDAKYLEFCQDINRSPISAKGPGVLGCNPSVPTATDNTDLRVPRAPKWSTNLGASYDIELNQAGTLTVSANWARTSSMSIIRGNERWSERKTTNLIDANIRFADSQDRFTVAAYGKNLTKELFINSAFPQGNFGNWVAYNRPREYGVQVGFKF